MVAMLVDKLFVCGICLLVGGLQIGFDAAISVPAILFVSGDVAVDATL